MLILFVRILVGWLLVGTIVDAICVIIRDGLGDATITEVERILRDPNTKIRGYIVLTAQIFVWPLVVSATIKTFANYMAQN